MSWFEVIGYIASFLVLTTFRSGERRQLEAPASSASASAWRRPFEASAVPE